MQITLQSIHANGSGRCSVLRDDGTRFSQTFHGMPVGSKAALLSALHQFLSTIQLEESAPVMLDPSILLNVEESVPTTTPPLPIDQSDIDNMEKKLKALALCVAQVGGLTVPQMKALFRQKWDLLP